MSNVREIMNAALSYGACEKSNGVTDWKSLCWLFFSPQGREFCEENNFPNIEMFRGMKDHVQEYGVFVDSGEVERKNDANIGLIGKTSADLTYDDNTKVHKVILMHGAKAKIKASNYAVLLLVNISGEVEIDKDDTVVIL